MANRFAEKFQAGLQMGQGMMDTFEKAQMRKELKEANALNQEQQQLGLNAPVEGAVPTGYENYLARDTQTGGFRPIADQETNPEAYAQQGIMAERFNAPNAFAGQKTSYSLGGVTRDTAFSPEEVANARMERKADIYSNYGREDLAEQMRTNALARQSAALQIKKLQGEVDDAAEFKKDLKSATEMTNSAAGVAGQAKKLLDAGDREGAARILADWRTNNVPDDKMIRINENGLLEGSKDGGKTWVQASADRGNVYNPGVVENMLGEVKSSADEHLTRIMFKHAKNPEALSQMITATKELALRGETLAENKRQFGETMGFKEKELEVHKDYFQGKLAVDREEARLRGLLVPAQIAQLYASADRYKTENAKDNFALKQLQGYETEKQAIFKDLDAGRITKDVAQERLNMASSKYGGAKLTEAKPLTAAALKDIEEVVVARNPNFAKEKPEVQAELRNRVKAELGYGSGAAPTDYMATATGDKGGNLSQPQQSGGLQPVKGGTLDRRQQAQSLLNLAKAESDFTGMVRTDKGVQAIREANALMQDDPYFDIMYKNTGLLPLGR